MKKHQKTLAVNNQEMEDLEVYTLYPENATINYSKKQQNKNSSSDPEYKISLQTNKHTPEAFFNTNEE